jgi:hypothetical protein
MMPAWKMEPVISDPPMEQWNMLQLPWSGGVLRLDGINMPNLQNLYCDGSPLTNLPWGDLRNLNVLGIYNCQFQALDLWRLPSVSHVYAGGNYALLTVDAHDNASLMTLDIYTCESLSNLDISGCTSFDSLYAYGCSFNESLVDQILGDLVATGVSDGYLQLYGGTNAPPSDPDGLAMMAVLIDRGWTVYTN